MAYKAQKFTVVIISLFISIIVFATDTKECFLTGNVKKQKISLNFQDIKVRSALQLLAKFSGFNLVVDDKVQGNISIHLNDMPWPQALDIILENQNLYKRPIKNGWIIATQSEFLERDKKKQEIQKQQQALENLSSKIIEIHYGKATELAALLKDRKNYFLSSRGSISTDKRTNSLLVQDLKEKLDQIEKTIRELDRPTKQVCIEARIVSIDKNKERELGARFGLKQSLIRNSHAKSSYGLEKNTSGLLSQLSMDLPLSLGSAVEGGIAVGSLGLHLMRLGENIFLDLELSALENEGGAQIISAPHLITEDQQTASIETGASIPYQGKTSSGATNVQFKKAVLSLKVTPHVMPGHRLILDLEVNQDQPSDIRVLDVPAINARHIKTKVIVKDGGTIVLGGIYEHSYSKTEQRIPFLGFIPLLGNLFSYKEIKDKRTELLIFVTPTIMDP
ncbi:MAG: type IV pilus secretin PilQ [Rickettsiella sp.]|nr:type IV pilus secretin PilQ [Rickettsiella sp.]